MTCRITWVAIGLLLFGACSAKSVPLPNKSTNWLRECTSDRMCSDGLSCLCGVCTKTCGRAADCGTDPATTRCSAISRAALSNQCNPGSARDAEAICVVACTKDNDCKSNSGDFECSDQVCVVRDDAEMPRDIGPGPGPMRVDAGHDINFADATITDGFPTIDGSVRPFCQGASCDAGIDQVTCSNVGDASVCMQPCHVACKAGQMCFGDACADVLAADELGPTSHALDSGHLYWTTTNSRDELGNYRKDGAVQAVSLKDGTLTTLASNRFLPTELAINATHAYWIEGSGQDPLTGTASNDNAVWRVLLKGGDPERVASGLAVTTGLAVNDSYVFLLIRETSDAWAPTSAVHRMPIDGSTQPERLFGIDGAGGLLLIDDAGLCWASGDKVGTASTDGADPHVLSMTKDGVLAIAVDASAVYWWTNQLGFTASVASVPRVGGDAHVLAREDIWDNVSGIAIDRDYVYSGHQDRQSLAWSVERTDKVLGTSQVVLQGLSVRWGKMMLAVDDDAIYIVTQNDPGGYDGLVLRVAK